MDDLVSILLNGILTTWIMLLGWATISIITAILAIKLQVGGLLYLTFGVLPKVIFYLYKLINIWDLSLWAIAYSRIADIVLVICLLAGLWQMYKSSVAHERIEY